jgi:hypothetical protein
VRAARRGSAPGRFGNGPVHGDYATATSTPARYAFIRRMIEYAVDITAGSLITADKQET